MQYTPIFLAWFALYPRKVGKRAALLAYHRAIKRGFTHEKLIEGAKAYAVSRSGQEPVYTLHPATWLNGDHVDDEPLVLLAKKAIEYESPRARRPSFKASDYDCTPSTNLRSIGEILSSRKG